MDGQTIDGTARRATVSTVEAARLLRVKPDSIRARLRRGGLEGAQDDAGVWHVYADQLGPGQARQGPRRAGRIAQDATGDKVAQRVAVLEAQLAAVIDERDNLRQLAARQAEAVNDAAGRLAELAERIAQLQLQAPPDAGPQASPRGAPGGPQTGVEAAGVALSTAMLGEEIKALRGDMARKARPWWRRIVGG